MSNHSDAFYSLLRILHLIWLPNLLSRTVGARSFGRCRKKWFTIWNCNLSFSYSYNFSFPIDYNFIQFNSRDISLTIMLRYELCMKFKEKSFSKRSSLFSLIHAYYHLRLVYSFTQSPARYCYLSIRNYSNHNTLIIN